MTKLSEILLEAQQCGDYGEGLDGLYEMAQQLESENERFKATLIDVGLGFMEKRIKIELEGCPEACKMLYDDKQALKQKYESTPQQALKAVMDFHDMCFRVSNEGSGFNAYIQLEIKSKNESKIRLKGYCGDLVTLTADDIKEDIS